MSTLLVLASKHIEPHEKTPLFSMKPFLAACAACSKAKGEATQFVPW